MKYRRRKRSLISYLVVFLVGIAFLATIGVRIIVSSISLLANFISSTKQNNPSVSSEDFFSAPEIIDIPEATNSAAIKIEGVAPDGALLSIFVNNVEKKQIQSEGGNFQTRLTLSSKNNSIFVEAQNPDTGKSKRSESHLVLFIKEPPILTINSPTEGQFVSAAEIEIKGSVSVDITVKIMGQPTVVNSQGEFSEKISLNNGENKLTVEAIDAAGNITTKEFTVIYEP